MHKSRYFPPRALLTEANASASGTRLRQEFAFEDGWWQGTLVYVAEAGVYPPVLLLCGIDLNFRLILL